MKIAVLWRPGRNVEWQNRYLGTTIPDDALEEATLHRDGLIEAGHDAELVCWRQDDLAGMLEELGGGRFDLVFNASSLAEVAFLEAAGIPYCGSGLDLVALDKAARKKILVYHGIPTAPFFVVDDASRATGGAVPLAELKNGWRPPEPLSYPLFVKPVRGRGSSGISDESIVHNHDELVRQAEKIITRLDQGALVERYVQGREVTVGLIGERPVVLTPLEIEYNQVKTNTYEHKMDREIFHCPARFSDSELERFKAVALDAFRALGARDYGRVDMMVDDRGQPTVLELNTFAGLQIVTGREEHLHASYIGEMARAMGMSRSELLGTIVESAARRLPTPTRPARADRPALTAHTPAAPPATNVASPEPG
ncbi:MAG TPA: D-alanine--D-alanine ligase [Clostridiales bacterium]|nr:D-alanine--D-alanine ligase [Clostridiales bacterium]